MCKRRTDAGQALVVVAFGMVILLGFLALGVDLGYLRLMKRRMQMLADAAALAGAQELTYCTTNNCSALTTAAQNALVENGFTGSALFTNCGASSGTLTITVNNPPCSLGSKAADPHYNDKNFVEVVVSQKESAYFSRIFGVTSPTVSARSEAALGSGNNCIYALDPTDSGTISADFLAFVNSQCGIVDESSSSSALTCTLLSSITGSQIGIVGGYSKFLCTISPTPKTHIPMPSPADPLAYLPTQSFTSCGLSIGSPYSGSSSAINITSGTKVFNPGTYCGGIQISCTALPCPNVTFNPGTYILTSINNSGSTLSTYYGLNIDIGTNITGSGVTFYNYGPAGPITFLLGSFTANGINLTAPTSGPYAGILFFQDPGNTSQAQIIGTSSMNTTLQGTYYFPRAKVVFAFDGPVSYNILDAWQVEFAVLTFASGTFKSSGFGNDYSSLANGSPIKGIGGVLVQ